MKKQLFKVIFCGMLLFFIGCSISHLLSENEVLIAIEHGNNIVDALEKHKIDFNKYPKDLDALMPNYITSLEKIEYGKWIVSGDENITFSYNRFFYEHNISGEFMDGFIS